MFLQARMKVYQPPGVSLWIVIEDGVAFHDSVERVFTAHVDLDLFTNKEVADSYRTNSFC